MRKCKGSFHVFINQIAKGNILLCDRIFEYVRYINLCVLSRKHVFYTNVISHCGFTPEMTRKSRCIKKHITKRKYQNPSLHESILETPKHCKE